MVVADLVASLLNIVLEFSFESFANTGLHFNYQKRSLIIKPKRNVLWYSKSFKIH